MATKKKLMLWTGGLLSLVLFVLLAIIGLVKWIVRPHGGGLQPDKAKRLIHDMPRPGAP